jgi:hypothetical protein
MENIKYIRGRMDVQKVFERKLGELATAQINTKKVRFDLIVLKDTIQLHTAEPHTTYGLNDFELKHDVHNYIRITDKQAKKLRDWLNDLYGNC